MKRVLISGLMLALSSGAAYADTTGAMTTPITTPTEVGTTSMPAGNYIVTEQSSHQSYALMVSSKGTMILSPAPANAAAAQPTGTAAVPAAAVATPAPGVPAAGVGSATMTKLMSKGLEKGAMQLIQSGATKQIKQFIPK